MVIAVEGLDGSGKSTIAKNLSKKLDFIYVEKPLKYLFANNNSDGYEELMSLAKKIYEVKSDSIRASFIGMGLLAAYDKFKDQNIVLDRHFLSNYFWNGSEESKYIFDGLIKTIGKPDLTIILYASPEERYQRIKKRDQNDPDLNDKDMLIDGYPKMIDFANENNFNYLYVDTSNKDEKEVLEEILNYINNLNNKRNR